MDKKKLLSSSGLIIAGVLLLLINLVAGLLFKSVRLDMTENSLYTLSDGTERILEQIDEPVTLRFYFSEALFSGIPVAQNYGRRVKELLEEYANIADGKIRLIVENPEPFSDEEDQAVRKGLQGVPVDAAGTQAYFGLVGTSSTDEEEIVPFFAPDKEESLEYDLTKLVHKLANPKRKVVGLISELPLEGGAPANPFGPQQGDGEWYILSQIKQLFEVRKFESSVTSIPQEIDVLMIVHPKTLSDQTLFAIDQFVLGGGRVLVFVDPHSDVDTPPTDPQNPMASFQAKRDSSMEKLFDAWGVELVKGQVVGDIKSATRVNARAGMRVQPVEYVAWLSLDEDNFNSSDFVTGELRKVMLGTAGRLKKKEGSTLEFSPLLETSDQAMTIPQSSFQFQARPLELLRNYRAGGEKLTVAARISGKFKSAFPDGLKNGDTTQSGTKESKEDSNVIIIADTDMLEDKMWVQLQNFFGNRIAFPQANNDTFVINALDNLTGSNDLISLRSRGRSARPFEKVQELKREAETRFRDKEKQLQDKLRETERKLSELQRQKEGGSSVILSSEQRTELEKFREQQVQTRKELRNVQHQLTQSIEGLGSWLKFLNITIVPFLIIIVALVLTMMRKKRLRASVNAV
ncbi:MAG: Gldg family protein [Gammaproteobacteria bacterium]|nr:Gldg family protein [Gammaproteobacteria bacterium]